jgi:hypothetical protein
MDKKIGIILTSIERPQALKQSVESIIAQWQEEWVLFVGLQDDYDSQSFCVMEKIIQDNPTKEIRLYDLEYDCGISKARNELIQKVNLWGIPFTILTADSITFDESMKSIEQVIQGMEWNQFDLCGLNLYNRIKWEAYLNLIDIPERCFELDFIKFESIPFVKCDIVRNFWIARTDALSKVPYDNDLIMCEHEDFFWRAKQQGLVVGCTNLCTGTYNKSENTPEYDKIRANNFRIGMQRLKDKYSLKNWVCYKNLENTKL